MPSRSKIVLVLQAKITMICPDKRYGDYFSMEPAHLFRKCPLLSTMCKHPLYLRHPLENQGAAGTDDNGRDVE